MKAGLKLPQASFTGEDSRALTTLFNLLRRWTQWHLVNLSHAGSTNIGNATDVALAWDDEEDDSQLHDAAGTDIRVPTSHHAYLALGVGAISSSGAAGTGRRIAQWWMDGSGTVFAQSVHSAGVSWRATVPIMTPVESGQTLQFRVRHDVGAGTDVTSVGELSLIFLPLN